jgi:endonuclease YncB( thermonuclease family)
MFLDAANFRGRHRTLHHRQIPMGGWLALTFSAGLVAGSLLPAVHVRPEPARAQLPRAVPNLDATSNGDGLAVAQQPVEVLRTLDGDTFEARVHLWPGLEMTTRVRLRGIDAPELKARCAGELQMAQQASDALRARLEEGGVTIFNIGPDKYNGRVVADVATRATPSVSAALLSAGYVRRYGGGHRDGWC